MSSQANCRSAQIDLMTQYINSKFSMSVPLFSSLAPAVTVAQLGDSRQQGRVTTAGNVPVKYQGLQTNSNIWLGTPSPQGVGTAWNQYDISANLGTCLAISRKQHRLNLGQMSHSVKKSWISLECLSITCTTREGGTFLDFNATFGYWDPFKCNTRTTKQLASPKYGQFMQNWWAINGCTSSGWKASRLAWNTTWF